MDLIASDIICLLQAHVQDRRPVVEWLIRDAPVDELVQSLSIAKKPLTQVILCQILRRRRAVTAINALIRCLDARSPRVRGAAADALAAVGNKKAGQAILQRFLNEKNIGVLRNYAIALGDIEYRPAIPTLIKALQSSDAQLRRWASWSLAILDTPRALVALELALQREAEASVAVYMKKALNQLKRRQRRGPSQA